MSRSGKASSAVDAEAKIRRWTNKAARTDSTSPPDLLPLCEALKGGAFKDARPCSEFDDDGHVLIEVTVVGPQKADGRKSRFLLPVHAAIARVLELAGATVKLHGGSSKRRYQFSLKMSSGTSPIETNLTRILFGMPSSLELMERGDRRDQHRYVLPENYKVRIGPDRDAFLARLIDNPKTASLSKLLKRLFRLADKWHGAKLERPAE